MGKALVLHTGNLNKQLVSMRAEIPKARDEALRTVASTLTHRLAEISRRDTNRYVRGWIEAAQDVGVLDVPVPALKYSSRREEYITVLEHQVERIAAELERLKKSRAWLYERPRPVATHKRKKRPRPGLRKLDRDIARTERRLLRANEELEKAHGSYAFVLVGGYYREQGGKQRNLNATVRDRVYGGRGLIVKYSDRAVLTLHNLEPHAIFVERKYGTLKMAEQVLKGSGAFRASKAYLRRVMEAAGRAARA